MKHLKWICITLTVAVLAACGAPQPETTPELDPNVVGGRDANIDEYPWMVAMLAAEDGVAITADLDSQEEFLEVTPITDAPDENELVQFCGGSLIAENWILSAAHCFTTESARISYEGAEGEASVVGAAEAIVFEDGGGYIVPNQVAFGDLEGDLEFAGEAVSFLAENPADDIDTVCATNEAFEASLESGQAIAVEVIAPETLEEAQAIAEELGQDNCSQAELEASYLARPEGNVVEIVSVLLSDPANSAEAAGERMRTRRTDLSALNQATGNQATGEDGQLETSGLPTMPVSGRRVFLTNSVQETPDDEDSLAVAAFLETLKAEGSLSVSYSPALDVDDPSTVSIMMGSESVNVADFRASGGEVVAVEEILVHPKYSPITIGLSYDYALLRLEQPVDRPTIALDQEEIAAGVATSVTGWGFTEGVDFTNPAPPEAPDIAPLQVADNIMTLSDAECQARAETLNSDVIFPNPFDIIGPTILCAETFSQEEDRELDACNGDSGGPLFREDEEGGVAQVGIVSFGYAANTNCGGEDGVAGYSRVSAGLRWITATMNTNGQW